MLNNNDQNCFAGRDNKNQKSGLIATSSATSLASTIIQPTPTTFNGDQHRHNFSPQLPVQSYLDHQNQINLNDEFRFQSPDSMIETNGNITEINNKIATVSTTTKTKEVSFLEFVEVSGDTSDSSIIIEHHNKLSSHQRHIHRERPMFHQNNPAFLSDHHSSTTTMNHPMSNGIYEQGNGSTPPPTQFHYEPLQPPAAITIQSSGVSQFNRLHSHSTASTNGTSSPLLSLLDPLLNPHHPYQPPPPPLQQQPNHNPHHPYHYFQPRQHQSSSSSDSYSTTISFQPPPQSFNQNIHHPYALPNTNNNNPGPLIQYWSTNKTDDSTIGSENCQLISLNQSSGLATNTSATATTITAPPPQYDLSATTTTTICKSSSSDSDTNDSATRLLSNDCCSFSEDLSLIQSGTQVLGSGLGLGLDPSQTQQSQQMLNLNNSSTIIPSNQQQMELCTSAPSGGEKFDDNLSSSLEMKLNPINLEDMFGTDNNNTNEIPMSDSLWIQMQQAQKFDNGATIDGNPLNRTGSCKNKKNFHFHRIGGTGKFGFVCPPKQSTIRSLVSGSISILVALALVFLLICYLNSWLLFSGFGSGSGKRQYSLDQDPFWWQGTTFYEIFPASFKDSDGDGFGDFAGITEKIPYLRSLGVASVRLSSIFAALDYPQRYENVLNFFTIDPHLGQFSDFVKMIETFHSNHIRVILELNPTITSDQHPWAAAYWLLNQTAGPNNGQYAYFYERPKTWTIPNRTEAEIIQSNAENLKWSSTDSYDNRPSRTSKPNYHRSQPIPIDDPFYFGNGLRLNWSHEPVRRQMLQVADHWLQWADGLYLKNLDQIFVENRTERWPIISDWLRQLRTILLKREQHLQNKLRESSRKFSGLFFGWKLFTSGEDNENSNNNNNILGITNLNWAPKKILICSSRFIEQHLSLGIKKRRKVRFKKRQNNKNQFNKPEFNQLELSDLDFDSNLNNTSGDIFANLHVMPSNGNISGNILGKFPKNNNNNISTPYSTNLTNKRKNNKFDTGGSILGSSTTKIMVYTFFELIHFELKLEPNQTDNIRDQINHVFLNSPANFPLILWSIGGVHRSRISNRLGSGNSLAAQFLLTMLPGTVSLFYGDEIGLENSYDQHTRNQYRAGQLCPMAWSSISPNGNFSQPPPTAAPPPLSSTSESLDPQPQFNPEDSSRNWTLDTPTTTTTTPGSRDIKDSGPSSSSSSNVIQSNPAWLPPNPDYSLINVEKRSTMVKLVSDLNHFRLDHLYLEQIPTIIPPKEPKVDEFHRLNPQQHNQQLNNQPNQSQQKSATNPTAITSTISTLSSSSKLTSNKNINYLFHYIDDSIVVLEQYFDRFEDDDYNNVDPTSTITSTSESNADSVMSSSNSSTISTQHRHRHRHRPTRRYRYVLFANFGDRTLIKDFSDKFRFSMILLASNANRTSEFLIMKQLRLDPGEAMIVTVE